MKKQTHSQVKVSPFIKKIVENIEGVGLKFLENARIETHRWVTKRPYNEESRVHEASIRWRRTAGQILKDGWVYQGKACTDLVIVFISFCRARGYETRFVKLVREEKGRQIVHSVAEVKVEDGWYTVDVAGSGGIVKGEIFPDKVFNGFRLWKKGRDAWDLGLTDFDSMKKIR